jgi:hypothetical protein
MGCFGGMLPAVKSAAVAIAVAGVMCAGAAAAQAILDPALGNSGVRRAWSALWTPEARNAALTSAAIDLVGETVGAGTSAVVGKLHAARDPVFREATAWLPMAQETLARTTDPVDRAVLQGAIEEANRIIERSYETSGRSAIGALESIYTKQQLDEIAVERYKADAR